MNEKWYLMLSGVIFALIGLFHLIRILFHWPAIVGTSSIPFAISFIVIVVAGVLAFWAFRLSRTVIS
ncbi:hypothetical protein VB715_14475 [Crocosphaera sp. UHCC 0190]|uniref:hypothetical protein n=1 Tax=Crocosphaera sp. UHCC 0190 TaxID=3110246 RepID=UPI002B2148D8|nr:hypothetical protein [Crocosphaera sp. UHCC 0190]MEA5510976.1 hypothetical protein [Crocosphaera sp. UHCC 0190]